MVWASCLEEEAAGHRNRHLGIGGGVVAEADRRQETAKAFPSHLDQISGRGAGVKAVPLMWGHGDVGLRKAGSRALRAGELLPCGFGGGKPGLWSLLCTQGALAQGGRARRPLCPGSQRPSVQTCAGRHCAERASLFWAVCSLQSSRGGAINNKQTKDKNGTCQGCEAQGCTRLTPRPRRGVQPPGHTGLLVLTGSVCPSSVAHSPCLRRPPPRQLAHSLPPCAFSPPHGNVSESLL